MMIIGSIALIISFVLSCKIVDAIYRFFLNASGKVFYNANHKIVWILLLTCILTGLFLLPLSALLGLSDSDSGRGSDYDYNVSTRQSAPINNAKVSSVPSSNDADNYTADMYAYPADDMYIYPTDTQYISYAELSAFSRHDIMLMRNEIYARHGYNFQNEEVRDYFMSKDWYYPVEGVNSSTFGVENMNECERANLETIVSYEKEQGWR